MLRKALGKGMPVILAVNKTDRSDARIEEVVDECYELFMELLEDAGLPAETLEFPIVYCNGRTGQASLTKPENGTVPDSPDLGPLVKTLLDTIPARSTTPRSRCARRSPTSTPPRSWAAWRCCASTPVR